MGAIHLKNKNVSEAPSNKQDMICYSEIEGRRDYSVFTIKARVKSSGKPIIIADCNPKSQAHWIRT